VFGAGKSHLMVQVVAFLARLLDAAGRPEARILVTAATNVAGTPPRRRAVRLR
jgi:hypothetical protein